LHGENRFGVRAGSRWPHSYPADKMPRYIPYPFFMGYTYKLLQKAGIASWIIDGVSEGYGNDEFLYEVMGYNPDLIVLETSTPSIENDLYWGELLKDKTGAEICFAGPHASFEREKLFKYDFINYVIVGEYEVEVVKLALNLKNGHSTKKLIETKSSGFTKFPTPERTVTPFYNYNDRSVKELEYPSLQVQTSRGCPFNCIFCLWPQLLFKSRYQQMPEKNIVSEIEYYKNQTGIRSFYIDDDTFNLKKDYIVKFAETLIDRNIELPWMAMARGDIIFNKEILYLLKKAGLIGLKFGVESVDENVLKEINKDLNIKKMEENILSRAVLIDFIL